MQKKDKELDSILQEARESYQRRIEDLKTSLKSISEEKDLRSELEKFSPFKTQLGSSDSLKYSVSFKPNSPLNDEEKYRLRGTNSEDLDRRSFFLNSKLENELEVNGELAEEVRNLRRQISTLEENLDRWKRSYQEAENTNAELRVRLKDATVHVSKLAEEASKTRDLKNGSMFKEINDLKLHYKKKTAVLKEELVRKDTEKKTILNEIDVCKQREKDLRRVCESQVKEICEEYSRNMRAAATIHNDELTKLKNTYEAISESQSNKFIDEINVLRSQAKEHEKVVKTYKANLESLISSKDSSEKQIIEKEEALKNMQISYRKLRSEFESQLRQLQEDKESKLIQAINLSEDLHRQNNSQVKLKLELEVQLESERMKISNLEGKFSRIEAAYSELHHNYQGVQHKSQVLEAQLHQQALDFQKKYDSEVNRYHEKVKTLEAELKNLYVANTAQAKEMEALKKLCAQIEVNQEEDARVLQQRHEENIREIKRIDRYEYLQLSDAFEATKEQLKNSEQVAEELENRVMEYERSAEEMTRNSKSLEKNVENYERKEKDLLENIRELRGKVSETNASMDKANQSARHFKDLTKVKIAKVKDYFREILVALKEELFDYKNSQQRYFAGLLKNLQNNTENMRKGQIQQLQRFNQESSLIAVDLKQAHERIEFLERAYQKQQISGKVQEEEIGRLMKIIDSRDPEKVKYFYESFLRQLMSQISFLEQNVEENYSDLLFQGKTLKEMILRDQNSKSTENEEILHQAKQSIDYYRDRLMKLESEKALENNKSQQELANLEQRLAQVLVDIRDHRD